MPDKQYSSPPAQTVDASKTYTATIVTTAGTMTAQLFPAEAPRTVNNFVFLAGEGFYDGVIFHRVIPGFMIQGGDPTGTGRGGPGYKFNDEPVTRRYQRGTLAMANAGPNTNGSQFFVMHADYPLPPNYTIFGKLTAGEEVVDAIAGAPTGAQDRPHGAGEHHEHHDHGGLTLPGHEEGHPVGTGCPSIRPGRSRSGRWRGC